MLKFSFGNRKLKALALFKGLNKSEVCAFDLPAGYSCPCADICLSYANKTNGKITDGKNTIFRCYAASGESRLPATRNLRWHNFDALKSSDNMVALIEKSLPVGIKIIRIHSSGDFYSLDYSTAWFNVAVNHPEIQFFGYTKVLPYVQAVKPNNFNLHYSKGGKLDILHTNEPYAVIVKNLTDAEKMGLIDPCIDNPAGDFDFIVNKISFALLLHGTQPARV